jgi:hypothetical protein
MTIICKLFAPVSLKKNLAKFMLYFQYDENVSQVILFVIRANKLF